MARLLSYLGAVIALTGAVILTGCDSGSTGGGGASGILTGSVNVQTGNTAAAATIPANGGAPATVNGVSGTIPSGFLPTGTTVPAGTPAAVIAQGSLPIKEGFPVGSTLGVGSSVANVNFNSGVGLGPQGEVTGNVVVPVTNPAGTSVVIALPQGNVITRDLGIQSVIFSGDLVFQGGIIIIPVPLSINGVIPNNGENAVGSHVTCTWGPGNNGRSATLNVQYGNGFSLHQSRVITNLTASFTDLTTDSSDVPAGGVQTVAFAVGPVP